MQGYLRRSIAKSLYVVNVALSLKIFSKWANRQFLQKVYLIPYSKCGKLHLDFGKIEALYNASPIT